MLEYDAVIIGSGLVGLATAYHVKRKRPRDNILVIDMLGSVGQGNSAKSGEMVRSIFSSPTNLTIADTTIDFYWDVQEKLGFDLHMYWVGYLWLLDSDGYKQFKPILKMLKERRIEHRIYEKKELIKRLNLKANVSAGEEARKMGLPDVDLGFMIPKAARVDVGLLVRFYEQAFLRLGGEILLNTKVEKIIIEPDKPLGVPEEPHIWQSSRVAGVEIEKGIIRAKKTIIATGVWINSILESLGVASHIQSWKSQVYVLEAKSEELRKLLLAPGFNRMGCMPFIILPKPWVYINPRPKENAFWTGYDALVFGRPFKLEEDARVEDNFYIYGVYPLIEKYFPQFKNARPSASWAGHLDINTLDQQPIVFEENGLIVVTGANGNGIMKADAMGRIAAAVYAGEKTAELFGGERIKVSDVGIKQRKLEREKFALI